MIHLHVYNRNKNEYNNIKYYSLNKQYRCLLEWSVATAIHVYYSKACESHPVYKSENRAFILI